LIQPIEAVAEDYYTRRSYSLAVLGSYHQIGNFLTRVASLPRIVTPAQLNVTVRSEETRTGDPQLEARFTIETYVLPSNHSADAIEIQ
jgi:type IV pilus assembly protein PilO